MTPVPPKTLVSTVQVNFCRAQILGLSALILNLNLTLPLRVSLSNKTFVITSHTHGAWAGIKFWRQYQVLTHSLSYPGSGAQGTARLQGGAVMAAG